MVIQVDLTPELVQVAAVHPWEPVCDTRKHTNDRYRIKGVVKMGKHKVGIVHVDVRTTGAQVNTRTPPMRNVAMTRAPKA